MIKILLFATNEGPPISGSVVIASTHVCPKCIVLTSCREPWAHSLIDPSLADVM